MISCLSIISMIYRNMHLASQLYSSIIICVTVGLLNETDNPQYYRPIDHVAALMGLSAIGPPC